VGGFQAPCELAPPANTEWAVEFRDLTKNPLTRAEVRELLAEMDNELMTVANGPTLDDVTRAAARVILRALLRGMRLKVVPRG
jgi:hypothetical protein